MKIKFCGNRSLSDVKLTIKSDADFLGFVFARSKRRVLPEDVKQWLNEATLKPHQKKVGVFVNATLEEIARAVKTASLDVVQLHGSETPDFCTQVKETCRVGVWKVIHHQADAIGQMEKYAHIVDAFLIDNKLKSQWGGTGTAFDWSFVPHYLEKAHELKKSCFIAGGINASNIHELLKFKPDGIDLASGIETNEQKDEMKISELLNRMKQFAIYSK